MEKNHRFANQSLSKGQNSDSKKNQDISPKWPRNSKRREQTNSSGYKPENVRTTSGKATPAGKTRTQTNFNYDKRSKQRPDAAGPLFPEAPASTLDTTDQYDDHYEGTGLASHGGSDFGTVRHELHSVFSPGSKKQSLNHLLNFHYTPRERDQPMRFSKTGNNRSYVKKVTYNKEQYLQANCQFVVRAGEDYTPVLASPDNLVDWEKIEQIHSFNFQEPQCPICLYPPVAAKMTKCGHIYCWPCILHYLALSDKAWRKCPICYDAIHVPDLRSCVLKPFHSYIIGETVTFQLMRREKSSMIVEIASDASKKSFDIPLFNPNLNRTILTKLLLAGSAELLAIIEREQLELENQIVVDGIDCPENIFVQQALEQLKDRRQKASNVREISTVEKQEENVRMSVSSSDEAAGFTVEETASNCAEQEETISADQSIGADFMIDEDSNFTLSDIDIVPTSTCASSDYYYFYQSTDGQPLYLHSMNTRMLQAMYGSLDKSPQKISGKIVHKDSSSMSEALRKRLKYLQHLPISTQFEVVEVEFKQGVISNVVLAQFKDEMNGRRKDRQKRDRAESIRARKISEFQERQWGKSLARSANINIDFDKHFPTCGNDTFDFSHEPTLFTSPSASNASASPCPSGPSWSKMLSTSPAASRWPSLPSGGSVNVFGPLAAPPPKIIQVTGSKMSTMPSIHKHRFTSESDHDDNDDVLEARAPELRNNFASAIGAALEKVSLNNELAVLEGGAMRKQKGGTASNNGAKKKKNKKTVLFTSNVI